MKEIIKNAMQSLQSRKLLLQEVEKNYSSQHFKFNKRKKQVLALMAQNKDSIPSDLAKKLSQNWEHLEMRIKDDKMPRLQIKNQIKDIDDYIKCFEKIDVLTAEQVKKYQSLSKLYLQIELQKNQNIITRHNSNIQSFVCDFENICVYDIKTYIKKKADYVAEINKTKDEMVTQLKKLFNKS